MGPIFTVFGMTRPGIKPPSSLFQGGHSNHKTIVWFSGVLTSHIHTHTVITTGFSVLLLKDTLTCRQEEELGFEPPTHRSLADLLCLLRHSQQFYNSKMFKPVNDNRTQTKALVLVLLVYQNRVQLPVAPCSTCCLYKVYFSLFSAHCAAFS